MLDFARVRPVVFVVFQSESLANGGVESATQILEHLDRPRVVVTQRESRFNRRWLEAGCEVHVWAVEEGAGVAAPALARWSRSTRLAWFNLRMANLVRERKSAVVHCNDIAALWHAGPGARGAGAGVVFNVRDMFEDGRPYGARWRLTHHLASDIVCLSHEMRGEVLRRFPPQLRAFGRARVSVIHSALDLTRLSPASDRERSDLRARLGMSDDAFEIVNVGAFCRKKNQLELLRETVPGLLAQVPEARITFVGDFHPERDDYAKECARAAAVHGPRVQFVGFKQNTEDYYRAADLLCLASRYEGLPRCMIESLACGTPVVSFDVTSAREFLDGPATGIVVPRYDYAGLRAALVRAARDGEWRTSASINARRIAERSFHPEAAVRAYQRCYEQLERS